MGGRLGVPWAPTWAAGGIGTVGEGGAEGDGHPRLVGSEVSTRTNTGSLPPLGVGLESGATG
eukprot:2000184-Pyramimonas_sp.AAC.1